MLIGVYCQYQPNGGKRPALPALRAGLVCKRWLGSAMMRHTDDNTALFVPLFDIAVRLDDSLQWKAPVYDRLELARLDQFLEREQVFELVAPI